MEYKKYILGNLPEGVYHGDGFFFAWDKENNPCVMRFAHQVLSWMKLDKDNKWAEANDPYAILLPAIDDTPIAITFWNDGNKNIRIS